MMSVNSCSNYGLFFMEPRESDNTYPGTETGIVKRKGKKGKTLIHSVGVG